VRGLRVAGVERQGCGVLHVSLGGVDELAARRRQGVRGPGFGRAGVLQHGDLPEWWCCGSGVGSATQARSSWLRHGPSDRCECRCRSRVRPGRRARGFRSRWLVGGGDPVGDRPGGAGLPPLQSETAGQSRVRGSPRTRLLRWVSAGCLLTLPRDWPGVGFIAKSGEAWRKSAERSN
jgi:hypothetical protein